MKDPIGFGGKDSNLYAYVFADPINYIDTKGESIFGMLSFGFVLYGGYECTEVILGISDEMRRQQESTKRFNDITKKDKSCGKDEIARLKQDEKDNLQQIHNALGEIAKCYWEFLKGRLVDEPVEELIEREELLTQ